MKTISSSDFASRPDHYLEMAERDQLCIQNGHKMFRIVFVPAPDQQPVLKPDDDLRRAITAEELIKRVHEDIRRKFASRV